METIRRGSARYEAAIRDAAEATYYTLDNGFQGTTVPNTAEHAAHLLESATALKAKLRLLDDGRFRLSFHSNRWVDLRAAAPAPAPAPEPAPVNLGTTAGFAAAIKEQIERSTGRPATNGAPVAPAFTWTAEDVVALLERSDDAVAAALVEMLARQTAAEQAAESTHDLNGVGFGANDAEFLTSLAKGVLKYGHLTARQLPFARRCLRKYRGQIAEIANANAWDENVKPPQPERPARTENGNGHAGHDHDHGNGNGERRNRCRRCNGTGNYIGHNGRNFGQCYTCNGRGYLTADDFRRMAARRRQVAAR